MRCKFYGCAGVKLIRTLVASGGNQCALITQGFAPCRMEADGKPPVLEDCELNGTRQALEFSGFEQRELAAVLSRRDEWEEGRT
jgi:hypothetical protein